MDFPEIVFSLKEILASRKAHDLAPVIAHNHPADLTTAIEHLPAADAHTLLVLTRPVDRAAIFG